jgi:sortase (surface protein transpeptidase)
VVRVALIRSVFLFCAVLAGMWAQGAGAATNNIVPPGWPKFVTIPSISVRAPVESLALNRPRDAEAPYKWGDVAWYNRSPRPGDPGRAQIYGHLDSTCCAAVFYRLKDLKKGNSIQVQYPNGKSLVFAVQWSATYWNKQVPYAFFNQPTTQRGIVLITCAGAFHRDGTGYDHKLVVYATLTMPPAHPPHK